MPLTTTENWGRFTPTCKACGYRGDDRSYQVDSNMKYVCEQCVGEVVLIHPITEAPKESDAEAP